MPYNPGINYQPADMIPAASQFGEALGNLAAKRKQDAQKAKTLRAAMRLYDPKNADRYETMSLADLEAETQAAALKRALAEQDARTQYNQSLRENMVADNARQDKQYELSKAAEARAQQTARATQRAGVRRDFLDWWDQTLRAWDRRNPPTYPEPRKIEVDGNPYLFQPATGQVEPLGQDPRRRQATETRLTAMYRNLAQLANQLDKLPEGAGSQEYGILSAQRRALTQRIVETERELEGGPAPGRQPAAPAGKPLTKQAALDFLRQANGDRAQAEELARQAGYTW